MRSPHRAVGALLLVDLLIYFLLIVLVFLLSLAMEIYEDFCPTLYSGFGDVEAEVVFAGYDISAPDLGWDDYQDINVAGKVVAILYGNPRMERKDFSKYSPRQVKLLNPDRHGACGCHIDSNGRDIGGC